MPRNFSLLLLGLGFFLFGRAEAQSLVHWVSFEEALALNQQKPKKILIDFYTVWCGPCKMMNKNTFENPVIAAYINEHYYAVKFNAEGNDTVRIGEHVLINPQYDPNRARSRNGTHQLTQAMAAVNGRIAYPTVVYLNEKIEIITPVQGYIQAPDMEPILHFIAEDAFQTGSFEEFKSSFDGTL